jgi:hypothetical protein
MAFAGDERLELAKDIIAMANTRDGGTIVIGIAEVGSGWEFIGLTPDQVATFDVTKVHDFVKQRAAPSVILYSRVIERQGKLFVVLQIPEFDDQPHICTKDAATSGGKVVFRRGDLLARTVGAASERLADDVAVRQLLNLAVQRRADTMLTDISRLMRGESRQRAQSAPFWAAARDIARRYSVRKGEFEGLGSWTFGVAPVTPLAVGADGPPYDALRRAVSESAVALRGWDFPHVKDGEVQQRKDAESGLAYLVQQTDWHHHVENAVVFENGYASVERILGEDLEARELWPDASPTPPGEYFNWLGAIYLVSEFLLFASRLYGALAYEGDIYYEVRIVGAAKRVLRSRTPGRDLYPRAPSSEDEIVVSKRIDTAMLRADIPREAINCLKQIFALFNWNNPDDAVLSTDINKLLTRRL